jgi:hypothetical protein
MEVRSYEAPVLRTLGTVHELTQAGDKCFFNKTWGPPDYALHVPIPITNCSS